MLKKLLKYELSYIYKFMVIWYSLALFFGILTRIFLSFDNSFILHIIGLVCNGCTISMIINILINNLIRLWVRFKQNLYGDESYLTHTLPIKKETLYLTKIANAIISLFTSILVIGLTLFIAYYSKENIELVKNILLPIADVYNSKITYILLAFLFIIFLEFSNALQAGFTGIILGHKMNNVKTGFSILYGFISYMIIQLFGLVVIFITSLFNKDLMNLFITNQMININMVKIVIYISIIIYSITLIINYLINIRLFKKGVNID